MVEIVLRKVRTHLTRTVGELVFPGEPTLDPMTGFWHIPVLYQDLDVPKLVGVYSLNAQGEFECIPDKEQMKLLARELTRRQEVPTIASASGKEAR